MRTVIVSSDIPLVEVLTAAKDSDESSTLTSCCDVSNHSSTYQRLLVFFILIIGEGLDLPTEIVAALPAA